MDHAWDTFIRKELQAVPLSPLHSQGLQLLDIFIKADSGRFRRRHDVQRAGSMLSLGRQNVERWKEMVEDPIKKGLDSLVVEGPKIDGFSKEALVGEYQASIKASASASLWASLGIVGGGGGANVDVRGAKSVACRILKPTSTRVSLEFLLGLVEKPASYWRLDTSKEILQPLWSTHLFGKRGMKIWVVSEILYAQGVSVTAHGEKGLGIEASTGIPDLPKAGTSISEQNDGSLLITALPKSADDGGSKELQPFPFAFRVLELKYDDKREPLPIRLRWTSVELPEQEFSDTGLDDFFEKEFSDTSLNDFFEHFFEQEISDTSLDDFFEQDSDDELRRVEIKLD